MSLSTLGRVSPISTVRVLTFELHSYVGGVPSPLTD
jgi:hypothetical protein